MIIMRLRLPMLFCALLVIGVPAMLQRAAANPAGGTELVMMESSYCEWCERWMSEIGSVYHKTEEGRIAPLRRVDIHQTLPQDLKFLKRANFTPTFILVSAGQEIGRIQGHPGENFFWPLLGDLLAKLRPAGPVEADAAR